MRSWLSTIKPPWLNKPRLIKPKPWLLLITIITSRFVAITVDEWPWFDSAPADAIAACLASRWEALPPSTQVASSARDKSHWHPGTSKRLPRLPLQVPQSTSTNINCNIKQHGSHFRRLQHLDLAVEILQHHLQTKIIQIHLDEKTKGNIVIQCFKWSTEMPKMKTDSSTFSFGTWPARIPMASSWLRIVDDVAWSPMWQCVWIYVAWKLLSDGASPNCRRCPVRRWWVWPLKKKRRYLELWQ